MARHIGELLSFYRAGMQRSFGLDIAPMHDVCEIIPYVRDGLPTYQPCHVDVELAGRFTRGMTVCDLRNLTEEGRATRGGREPNALVALHSAARAVIRDVVDTILSYR